MSDTPSAFSFQPSAFGAKQLEHFRASKRHLPLHPLEKAVLTVVALHLCFLPWALGTMHVWSQLTSLSLSLLSFTLALIPRVYSGDFALPVAGQQLPVDSSRPPSSVHRPPSTGYRLIAWPRLVRFPLFWIGLALLAYIAIQGFNPSWVWERNATTWWLRRVNDIPWLPTSIDTPFERFNLWRQFIIYASAWLTVCTVWVGFTRRRSLQLLLTVLVLNAVALATVGFERRLTIPYWNPEYKLTASSFILWLENPLPGASTFASFVYKNHAGAYFSLLAGVAIGLAAWHHERGLRNLARSTPGMLWLLVTVVMTFGVFYTYSRGATIILAAYFILAAAIYLGIRLLSSIRSTTPSVVWMLITGLLVGAVAFGASQLNYAKAKRSYASLFENQEKDVSVAHRLDAYSAGATMLSDNWERGIGAGGFRFLFPEYIKQFPASYKNGQLFWEHAHCDWLQFPIELGATGCLLLILGGGSLLLALIRQKLWRHGAMLLLVLACLQTLAQAVFDFPFQSPAILLTWCVLLILALRWSELEAAQ